MREFFSEYKKSAISAVVFFATLVGMTSAYAAFTALTDVIAGQTLSKDAWNTMVGNLSDLNSRAVPQGAVMAFFWTSCPANWSPADGTTNGVMRTNGTAGTLDLRGEFIRGLDSAWVGARNVDTGRALGSSQLATAFPNTVVASNLNPLLNSPQNADSVGPVNQASYVVPNSSPAGQTAWALHSVRPRNVALLYCVKN